MNFPFSDSQVRDRKVQQAELDGCHGTNDFLWGALVGFVGSVVVVGAIVGLIYYLCFGT